MPELNQNMLLAADNLLDTAVVNNPSAFNPSFPASYSQDRRMWLFSQFASVLEANTHVIYDFGSNKTVQLFACLKHNVPFDSLWRIRVYTSLVIDPVYDSGFIEVFQSADPESDLDWASQAAHGGIPGVNRHAYHVAPDDVVGRYVRIDFNTPDSFDTFIRFARMWASPIYQPSLNMVYGAEVFIDDVTEGVESENKVMHFDPLVVKQRRLLANFNDLPTSEILQIVFGTFFMRVGRTGELIGILQPLSPETYHFQALPGRLVDTEGAKHTLPGRMSSGLHIVENM